MLLLIGIPVVDACSGDARGVVACVRDQINHKFGLPAAPDTLPAAVSVESAPAPTEPSAAIEIPAAVPGTSPVAKPFDASTPVAEAPGAGEQTPDDAAAPTEVIALPAGVAEVPVAPADAPLRPAEAATPQAVADVPEPPPIAPDSASEPLPAVTTGPAVPTEPAEPIPLTPEPGPVAATPSVPDAEPPAVVAGPESVASETATELAIADQPPQPAVSSSDVATLEDAQGLETSEPPDQLPMGAVVPDTAPTVLGISPDVSKTDPPLTPSAPNLDLLAATSPVADLPVITPDPHPLPAGVEMPSASPAAPQEIAETPAVLPTIEAILPPADLPPPMPPVLQPKTVPPVDPIELSAISPAPPAIPADVVKIPVLAPTIDAIEIEGDSNFVAGDGPEGATVRLYVDDQLVGETTVSGGRWLVEGIYLLGKASSTLRIEAVEPATGKLLGSAVVSFEIELPKAPVAKPQAPPAAEPEATTEPDLVPPLPPAIAAQAETTPELPLAGDEVPLPGAQPESTAVTEIPADQPAVQADMVDRPAVAPTAKDLPVDGVPLLDGPAQPSELPGALVETTPAKAPAPLPPITPVTPTGSSASVTILASPASEDAEILSPPAEIDPEPAVQVLPLAAVADLMLPVQRHIPLIRAYPIGDFELHRFASGKAIIRRGDTLWSIARRYYGHGIHFWTIVNANRDLIRRPSRIYPGQAFTLPPVTDE